MELISEEKRDVSVGKTLSGINICLDLYIDMHFSLFELIYNNYRTQSYSSFSLTKICEHSIFNITTIINDNVTLCSTTSLPVCSHPREAAPSLPKFYCISSSFMVIITIIIIIIIIVITKCHCMGVVCHIGPSPCPLPQG